MTTQHCQSRDPWELTSSCTCLQPWHLWWAAASSPPVSPSAPVTLLFPVCPSAFLLLPASRLSASPSPAKLQCIPGIPDLQGQMSVGKATDVFLCWGHKVHGHTKALRNPALKKHSVWVNSRAPHTYLTLCFEGRVNLSRTEELGFTDRIHPSAILYTCTVQYGTH